MIGVKQRTIKNLAIVEKFTKPIIKLADGILLTGSNAWGAHHAVTPKSDIDLFIIVDGMDQLNHIIEIYVDENLIESKEKERLRIFKGLYKQNRANQFSIIANNLDTPVSIDFMLFDTVKNITSLIPMKNFDYKGINIRVVDEFRENIPRVTGYSLDGLNGQKEIYHPKFEEIKNDKNMVVGYLSETLVDGQSGKGSEMTYFLGVMSFFLAIDPVVLLDRNKRMVSVIKAFQSNIAKIMKGKEISYITRQERMPEKSLRRVLKSLTLHNEN